MASTAELIFRHFPDFTDRQKAQFEQLGELYTEWNAKINVISRKDIDNLYERHVLHSLAIMKVVSLSPGTRVLDIGTGGGFPGIPLAIAFPQTKFVLVDSTAKKITVVNAVAEALGLENVQGRHERAEKVQGPFDFIVSRAVTALPKFLTLTKGKIRGGQQTGLEHGILYLKGGDFHEELNSLKLKEKPRLYDLSKWFEGEFFETKRLVHLVP